MPHDQAYLEAEKKIQEAQQSGATGYLNKEMRAKQFIGAIRCAVNRETLFDEMQIARARQWHNNIEKKWNSLTEQERQSCAYWEVVWITSISPGNYSSP